MSQVTVISGVERRRVWTVSRSCAGDGGLRAWGERGGCRAARGPAAEPAVSVATPPGRAGGGRLRGADRHPEPEPEPEPEASAATTAIVLELGGAVLRIAADAPPALLAAVLRSLRR
jgi:transposase